MGSRDGTLSWPLERAARVHAGALAVIDGERRLTYGEVARRVRALGAALDDLGIAPGARVGVLANNSLAHLEAWLGVPAYGRVLNDLNIRLALPEMAFMIDDCQTEVLIVDAAHLEAGRQLKERCASLRELVITDTDPCPPDCVAYEQLVSGRTLEPPDLDSDTLAVICYTGGTTGLPKGVMLSHANLLANAKHYTIEVLHVPTDRYLHASPMFHLADSAQTYSLTWVGGVHVILPRFEPATVARAIGEHRVTIAALVPTMIQSLLEHLDQHPADLSSLRLLIYAAAPMSPDLLRRVMATLDCDLRQGYGMTEAAPAVTMSKPEDHRLAAAGQEPYLTRLGSVGPPHVGVEAEIRDENGQRVPDGVVGEVWVRGPNVMLGYWNRPEETAHALVDGWYRSGDAAYQDADGYVYLVGRMKDMIITGGENVYPIEVENAILEHPAVREAAVIGIPDDRWGEKVHAVVVPVPGAAIDVEELVQHVRARIAGYKVPRSVEVREQPLPKSGAGKILKQPLREPFWAERARKI